MANIEARTPQIEALPDPETAVVVVESAEVALQDYLERVRPFEPFPDGFDEEFDEEAEAIRQANPRINLDVRDYQRLLVASRVLADGYTESQQQRIF